MYKLRDTDVLCNGMQGHHATRLETMREDPPFSLGRESGCHATLVPFTAASQVLYNTRENGTQPPDTAQWIHCLLTQHCARHSGDAREHRHGETSLLSFRKLSEVKALEI